MAARSKAWFCGLSLGGIAGSNITGGYGSLSSASVVCRQAEVSATFRSVFQRRPTECNISENFREKPDNEKTLAKWKIRK